MWVVRTIITVVKYKMNTMGNRSKVDKNQTSKAFLPSGDSDDYDMIL